MTRRSSSSTEVERLISELEAARSVRQEAAVARLRIIGERAVARLVDVVGSHRSSRTRALALTALEGTNDPRAVDAALGALDATDPETTIAALGVLRRWVTHESGTRVLDAIAAIAVGARHDSRVRAAALDALAELPPHLVKPLADRAPQAERAQDTEDPVAIRDWIEAHGASVPLSRLHELIQLTRDRERTDSSADRRQHWLRARGMAHAALGRRESRVALYDLRETFETTHIPLPLDFITAVTAVGDVSCLEPLARAWAALPRDEWWRQHLVSAARDVMRRARLTGRHAIVKRIRANWPGFL